MRIGLDLCDTVADAHEAKRRALEGVTGLSIPPERFRGKATVESGAWFQFRGNAGSGRSLDRNDWDAAMRYVWERQDVCLNLLEPMSGAAETIRALSKAGHEVGIVTSTKGLDEGRVWAWSNKYDLPVSFVCATQKKPKTEHYESCDVAIDNDQDHLLRIRRDIVRLLMLAPKSAYQFAPKVPKTIRVIRSWREVMPNLMPLAA